MWKNRWGKIDFAQGNLKFSRCISARLYSITTMSRGACPKINGAVAAIFCSIVFRKQTTLEIPSVDTRHLHTGRTSSVASPLYALAFTRCLATRFSLVVHHHKRVVLMGSTSSLVQFAYCLSRFDRGRYTPHGGKCSRLGRAQRFCRRPQVSFRGNVKSATSLDAVRMGDGWTSRPEASQDCPLLLAGLLLRFKKSQGVPSSRSSFLSWISDLLQTPA